MNLWNIKLENPIKIRITHAYTTKAVVAINVHYVHEHIHKKLQYHDTNWSFIQWVGVPFNKDTGQMHYILAWALTTSRHKITLQKYALIFPVPFKKETLMYVHWDFSKIINRALECISKLSQWIRKFRSSISYLISLFYFYFYLQHHAVLERKRNDTRPRSPEKSYLNERRNEKFTCSHCSTMYIHKGNLVRHHRKNPNGSCVQKNRCDSCNITIYHDSAFDAHMNCCHR